MTLPELLDRLFLRLASNVLRLDTVGAEEADEWPEGALDLLQKIGLLSPMAPRRAVLCDACDQDHEAEVHLLPAPSGQAPRAYIVCPSYGQIMVDPARQRRWRISLSGLASFLSERMGSGSVRQLREGLWHLGALENAEGPRDLLLLGPGIAISSVEVRALARPVLLLTGEPTGVPGVLEIPVSRLLNLADDDVLREDYLRAVLAGDHLVPEDAYVFRPEGDAFAVVFSGHWLPPLANLLGLRYLHFLLQHEGEEVNIVDLYTQVRGAPSRSDYSLLGLRDQGVAAGSEGDLGEALDSTAKRQLEQKARRLAEEINDARTMGEETKEVRLLKELEDISVHLASTQGLGSESRRMGGPEERALRSVRKAIGEALKRIRAHDEDCSSFLQKSVTITYACVYSPDSPPPWRLF